MGLGVSRSVTPMKPREAASAARKLGWSVEPKAGTGEWRFTAPDGRRFTTQAHGRTDQVPRALAKVLQQEMSHA